METIRIERDRKHISHSIIPEGWHPNKKAEYFRKMIEDRKKEKKSN